MKIPVFEFLFCLIVFVGGLMIPIFVVLGGIWNIAGLTAHAATHLALLNQILAPIFGVIYILLGNKAEMG